MKLLSEVDEEDFAKKLEAGQELLALEMIPLALAACVLMFGGVIAYLFFMILFVVVTLPSKERIMNLLRQKKELARLGRS